MKTKWNIVNIPHRQALASHPPPWSWRLGLGTKMHCVCLCMLRLPKHASLYSWIEQVQTWKSTFLRFLDLKGTVHHFWHEAVWNGHPECGAHTLTYCPQCPLSWELVSFWSVCGHLWSVSGSSLVQKYKMFISSKPCLFEWVFFFP